MSARNPEKWMGKIASFSSVPGDQKSERYIGEVIGVRSLGSNGPGNPGAIPDFEFTVRGRTGKQARITILQHYISLYDSWEKAKEDLLQS